MFFYSFIPQAFVEADLLMYVWFIIYGAVISSARCCRHTVEAQPLVWSTSPAEVPCAGHPGEEKDRELGLEG